MIRVSVVIRKIRKKVDLTGLFNNTKMMWWYETLNLSLLITVDYTVLSLISVHINPNMKDS